ncbi:MAG: AAA family ATPase [Okeania sp. SIO3I5]|uniref:AAA family ATPase n=1 Tax=Okeania sp. SIO3I5 TaxID=2607805 RepID=UPI0013B6E72E|nr:AAA family ATPase [Okeania sp. SIO3I5]NEQ41487.1 AAA family ATPase [Okeania sp. SIO3I5]
MYISKFQILNYKSFRDSGSLEFQPGINIIVGTNNSGKTALLESLGLEFEDNPYRNIRMRDIPDSEFADKSVANITFRLEKSDISALIDEREIYIENKNALTIFQEWFNKVKDIEVTVCNYNNKPSVVISDFPEDINLYQSVPRNELGVSILHTKTVFYLYTEKTGEFKLKEPIHIFEYSNKPFPQILFNELKGQIYKLNAERFHIDSRSFGSSLILKPDASNLAEVVDQIDARGKEEIYEKFNKYANILFPEIKEVFASSKRQTPLEVLVWSPEAFDRKREDLALKLADCGTGVSQVLAILYVIVTALEPKIIIIDEPQSFLHPSLIRKLINIFKKFPQHQYFIATHSPTVISEANPATILQLSYSEGETKTKIINSKETTELRALLTELGVRLSDVFGADAILWVEGPTEELCFPRILEKFGYFSMKSIQIIAVKNTGDLAGKRADTFFDIYDRLSGGKTLLPPATTFILDSENRTKKEKEDISRRGKEKVKFLERCSYENYLLHPQAIFEILKQENPSLEIAVADIKNYIDEAEKQKLFLPKNCVLKNWKSQVNGAEVIKEIFSKFSNNTVEYRKTKHSLEITNWLLEHEQNYLQKLAEFLKEIIQE